MAPEHWRFGNHISFASNTGPAAVYADYLTGHIAAFVCCEKYNGGVKLAGMPMTLHGTLALKEVVKLLVDTSDAKNPGAIALHVMLYLAHSAPS